MKAGLRSSSRSSTSSCRGRTAKSPSASVCRTTGSERAFCSTVRRLVSDELTFWIDTLLVSLVLHRCPLGHDPDDVDPVFFDIIEDAEVSHPKAVLGRRGLPQPFDTCPAFERWVNREHSSDLIHDSGAIERSQPLQVGDRLR